MNETNCPTSLLDPPEIVPLDVIDAVTIDSGFGSLLDLFSDWEEDCEKFWKDAEKLIFDKSALADTQDLWGFFERTAAELLALLISKLHDRYSLQAKVVLNSEQVSALDDYYISCFDELFHLRAHENMEDRKLLHQSMFMNGFPLSCGDAYTTWEDSKSDLEREKKFYKDVLGLTLVDEDNERKESN